MIVPALGALGGALTSSTGLTLLGIGASALTSMQSSGGGSSPTPPPLPAVAPAPAVPAPATASDVVDTAGLEQNQRLRAQRARAAEQDEGVVQALSPESKTAVSLTQDLLGR